MSVTSIEWTDRTWNPTRGCSRVSAGCDHCYAMREARRHDHPGGAYDGLTKINTGRTSHLGVDWRGVVRLVPEMLNEPQRWRKPQRVFVNSMSDLFHESLTKTEIEQVFDVMSNVPRHTFQVLTKRPERMREWMEWRVARRADLSPNVWLGVSVEDQATADERIPLLLQTPAAKRFVSYEPALGPVDFTRIRMPVPGPVKTVVGMLSPVNPTCERDVLNGRRVTSLGIEYAGCAKVDWIIVGGESGPGARPFDVTWARSTVEQCKAAGVACFIKQVGARPFADPTTPIPSDRSPLRDRKGGDPSEWPADLRVREFPA